MLWSEGKDVAQFARGLADTGLRDAPISSLVAWCLLHLLVAGAVTWWVRGYALRHALLDHPDARRSHVVATPRGGGLSIVVVMLAAIAWMGWSDPSKVAPLLAIGTGLGLVAGIGWIDDHRPLSPWLRLVVHAIAATLLALAIHLAGGSALHAWGALALALILTNVWNFMDGIDGLAASQAGIVALGIALVARSGVVGWLALALLAGCCGFLPFNLPRARIFLGDVGSGALGYAVAALFAMLAGQVATWSLLLLPLSAFLIDATLTLSTRIVRGERWWSPHVSHVYQQWARRTGRHLPVTLVYAIWSVFMVTAMVVIRDHTQAFIMTFVVACYLAGIVAWFWLRSLSQNIAGEGAE